MTRRATKNTPDFFNCLSESDKQGYNALRRALSSSSRRSSRNTKKIDFHNNIEMLKEFCIRQTSGDSLRCMVCGICWFEDDSIALNIQQLKYLIQKCKSSINTTLRKMGYKLMSSRADTNQDLVKYFSFLDGNTKHLRNWSVRTLADIPEGVDPEPLTSPEVFADELDEQVHQFVPDISLDDHEDFFPFDLLSY